MRRIRDVIKNIAVPTWIDSVPYNYGDAAAGTLKAGEWRALSTIHLPIALISLWGEGTAHPSDREALRLRQVLDHTMLMVASVTLACARTMTAERSEAYSNCMRLYMAQLPILFPHLNFRPNQHMSLHLPHFFRLFGPARSWWCFPYERIIGQIQRILSNHKLGMRVCF